MEWLVRQLPRPWKIWSLGTLAIAFGPLVSLALVLVVYALTGNSLWVRLTSYPEVDGGWLAFPLLFLGGSWPLLGIARYIHFYLSGRRGEPPWLSSAVAGSMVLLLLPNLMLWIAFPEEMCSNAPDAGQGSGVFLGLMMFVTPLLAWLGWMMGKVLHRFTHRGS